MPPFSGTQPFICSWIGFLEAESELDHYTIGVGNVEGDDGVMAFVEVPPDQLKYLMTGTASSITFYTIQQYFIQIYAFNSYYCS